MKKSLFFAAFILAVFSVSAYAQCKNQAGKVLFCNWGDGKCWTINPETGKNCTTRVEECEGPAGDLKEGGPFLFVDVTGTTGVCNGTAFTCDGCTVTGDAPSKFCDHGPCVGPSADGYSCTSGGCYPISTPAEETACTPATKIVASCPVCDLPPANRPAGSNCGGSTPSSASTGGNTTSSSSTGNTPIISHNSAPVIGLNVVSFARSLKIASGKDATVSLFDMNGRQVLSQRVFSGTTTISLAEQREGVYYAVVKSASHKQTVKVVLK